jgi:urease accessory protein
VSIFEIEEHMVIVEQLIAAQSSVDLGAREEDSVAMTWEQRRWLRGKFTTKNGREIALALPTGTVLSDGAILCLQTDWYLRVTAAPEPVLAVQPINNQEAVRLAFEIGNRHFSLALDGETLLVPDDIAMTQLFDRLHVTWERRQAVFSPFSHGHRHEH